MANFTTDAEAQAFADEHLLYELAMLLFTSRTLGSIGDQNLKNACIESYALHLRNWEDFFFTPPKKPDDVTWRDYVALGSAWSPRQRSPSLETAGKMVDKQIAHITTLRYAGSDPRKTWNSEWALEIHAILRDLAQNAHPGRLSVKARAAFLSASGSPQRAGTVSP